MRIFLLITLLLLLISCQKEKSFIPEPFSRGPSGAPVIGEPTTTLPHK